MKKTFAVLVTCVIVAGWALDVQGASLKIAQDYIKSKDYALAAKELDAYTKENPRDSKGHLIAAVFWFKVWTSPQMYHIFSPKDCSDKFFRHLEEAKRYSVRNDEVYVRAMLLESEFYLQVLGKWKEAVATAYEYVVGPCEGQQERTDVVLEALHLIARAFRYGRDYDSAIEVYEEMMTKYDLDNESFELVLFAWAETIAQTGDIKRTESAYRTIIDKYGRREYTTKMNQGGYEWNYSYTYEEKALWLLGEFYYKNGYTSKAKDTFKEFKKKYPHSSAFGQYVDSYLWMLSN